LIQLSLTALSLAATNAAAERSTSAAVVAHEHTLMRMAGCPCQVVPPHQYLKALHKQQFGKIPFKF
jgi:hypothetical protein